MTEELVEDDAMYLVDGNIMTVDDVVQLACDYSEAYDNGYRTLPDALQVLEEHGVDVSKFN